MVNDVNSLSHKWIPENLGAFGLLQPFRSRPIILPFQISLLNKEDIGNKKSQEKHHTDLSFSYRTKDIEPRIADFTAISR